MVPSRPGRARVGQGIPEYAAGSLKRFWLGSGYRDLWTTPVRLPLLDLQTEFGGLKPVRQVGQNQSVGLAMAGGDGRSYTFRSLHKEADRMLMFYPAEESVKNGLVVTWLTNTLFSKVCPLATRTQSWPSCRR